MNQTNQTGRIAVLAAAASLAAVLTGCASESTAPTSGTSEPAKKSAQMEVSSSQPRLAVSYDGGVMVLDADSLDVLAQLPVDGFARINPAGDGRHLLVSTGSRFRVLDAGAWSEQHGDHAHHYAAPPAFVEVEFAADKPGHVVRHGGRTALFDDGTGDVASFDPRALAAGMPDIDRFTTPAPHHGVAVPLPDGGLVTTVGDEQSRTGIVVLDRDRREVVRNEQCPGVHGEAAAADGGLVFGCQDGVLIYRDGVVAKVSSPDAYGRIGNQAGGESSPVVLGDYKTDPVAKLERPQRVMLLDTAAARLTPVDLGASYSFRSLGRGPRGEAVVLGTDGALHVVDQNAGTVTKRISVQAPWTEPDDWQQARPALFVAGETAYVTEPSTNTLRAVNLDSGAVVETVVLPQTPNELTGVTG
ncbi:zinc metallochaperone AztD [Rhodococcus sp. NPDC127528]|uniref:zinc metallochaperone AztD n=1 Tax=unclassified Rhodococcus (in: high G+C Gram-positive bacteria) TaxID=192944 RepID=UPI003628F93D